MLKASTRSPFVYDLLREHPKVQAEQVEAPGPVLEFHQDGWHRSVSIGTASEFGGLTEIIDNNPLVCADHTSVPGPAATLAWIALAPIIQSGLVVEAPTVLTNAPGTDQEIALELEQMGWKDGVTFAHEPKDLGGVCSLTAIVAVRTPEDLSELDEAYEERFGRAFFVRRDESSTWDVELVKGKPWAVYRLRVAPDQPYSLLTIQVLADAEGKAGAAQIVHRMNVMAGFEESLGLG